MNANPELLEWLLNEEAFSFNLNEIQLEGNPAMHLALAYAPFKKYRERCVQCLRIIIASGLQEQEDNEI